MTPETESRWAATDARWVALIASLPIESPLRAQVVHQREAFHALKAGLTTLEALIEAHDDDQARVQAP